ncbi:MAG: hypothetical protein HC930_03390 [Hydrococcus sp. SU_1_0]|nr:hypothetical protein [Hydrococcus sp. SU_1_0]
MSNKIFWRLSVILLISAIWQPSHHYLMNQGISMTGVIHSLITIIPFLIMGLILVTQNAKKILKN